jgi:starch synthase
VPAIREVLTDGETGILVAPDDPAALAGGIVTLLADPVRADRIGTAGREWVRSRTWDARARLIRTFVDAVARR